MEKLSKLKIIFNNKKSFILVVILFFTFLIFEFYQLLRENDFLDSKIRALVVKRDVLQNEPINFPILAIKHINKNNIPRGCSIISDQEIHMLSNMYAANNLNEGSLLCWENIMEKGRQRFKIPKGLKAYSFKPSNFLEVFSNDRIDITLSTKDETITLIENALVLGRTILRGKLEVIIAITQKEVELLEKASRRGDLSIVLRNPEDISSSVKTTLRNKLFKKSKSKIEIWAEK